MFTRLSLVITIATLSTGQAFADEKRNHISLNLSIPSTQIKLYSSAQNEMISYAPKSPRYLGIGLSYDDFAVGFGYDFKFINAEKSDSYIQYDLRLGHSWENVAIDAGYAKYSGFNIVNSKGFVDSEIPQHRYLERKDLKLVAISLDTHFLLWTDGFRLSDALGTNPNRGSGQGLLCILSGDRSSVHDATGLVPESAREKFTGSPGLTDVGLSLIAFQLGYGISHNWDGIFLNSLISYGFGLQYVSYDSDMRHINKSGTASKLGMKGVVGYAHENLFGGLLVGIEEPRYELNDIYVETSRQQMMIFIGSLF
jgi:hypothetical protein